MADISYPATKREMVVDLLHGVDVHDPYRWLETDSEEVTAWEETQSRFANDILSSYVGREDLSLSIRKQISETPPDVPLPLFYDKYIFATEILPEADHPVLIVSDRSSEKKIVLVDPNKMSANSALDWFYPSPGGDYVAYGISRHGDEQSVLSVVETKTGVTLPRSVPFTSFARVAWLPDSSGFYFSGGLASDLEDSEKHIFFYPLKDSSEIRREPLLLHDPYLSPVLSPDGRYLVANRGWESPCAAYYIDRLKDQVWKPFLKDLEGESFGCFYKDSFITLTTYKAPRGRIIEIPVDAVGDEEQWKELVPESDAVLQHFIVIDDTVVISELINASSRLRLISLYNDSKQVVVFSEIGLIRNDGALDCSPFSTDGEDIYFCYTTFTEPCRLYRLKLSNGKADAIGPKAGPDLSNILVRQVFYRSNDKTIVPMFLLHKKDLDLSQAHHTLLYGYGGWNLLPAPDYVGAGRNYSLPFLQAGGICAYPSLRGGSEFGRLWWMGGRLSTKQNTFDDFYAAAEYLIAEGLTTPQQLAISGASNGGLLTAVAITQRPDLFKAAVSQVPLTDMLRAMKDPYLSFYKSEYGDPDDSEMFKVLLSYSPVHNVNNGVSYPAALFLSGRNDIRVQKWNGTKMAALLQSASVSGEPILLKVVSGGHGPGLSLSERIDRYTDILGFIMQQLGMNYDHSMIL